MGMILLMMALSAFLLFGNKLLGTSFDRYIFSGAYLLPLCTLMFLLEFRLIRIEPDCLYVRNFLGIKRTVYWERVTRVQLVKQKETYHLLIVLDGHPTFGGYKKKALLYAWGSPIKVIHLVIPGGKRKEYMELIRRVYPKAVYLNCDGISRKL